MAVPNPNTIQNRNKSRCKYRHLDLWILCSLLVGLFSIIRFLSTQTSFQDEATASSVIDQREPVQTIMPVPLESERIFLSTIRSCIPANHTKCMQYIPPGTTAERIAVLVPPGEFGDWVTKWIIRTVRATFGKEQSEKLQLIHISHIPPYGYGKTHGWMKIIRVLPSTLMLGAADAIRSSLDDGQSQSNISLDDLKSAFRMLTRWHCRISHIAAHTAVLTIDMKDYDIDPVSVTEMLVRFVDPAKDGHSLEPKMINVYGDDDQTGNGYLLNGHTIGLLTWIQQSSGLHIAEELEVVLKEELQISKDFSAWPCQSFWSTGEEGGKSAPMASKLAAKLSPDCNAEYTTCVVKKDHCEEAGDPICI